MTTEERTSPFSRLAHYPIEWDLNEEVIHGETAYYNNKVYQNQNSRNSMLRADNIHQFNDILQKISEDHPQKSRGLWSKFEKWVKSVKSMAPSSSKRNSVFSS